MLENQQYQNQNSMQNDYFLICRDYRSKCQYDKPICPKESRQKKFFWTQKEHGLYVQLLQRHKRCMENREERKQKSIFCMFSKYFEARTPVQIKTHHQKMIIKYHTVEGIIKAAEQKGISFPQEMDQISSSANENDSNKRFDEGVSENKDQGQAQHSPETFLTPFESYFPDAFEDYRCDIEYGDDIFDLI